MSARLRVVGWQVQPVVMLDDGENLTSLPIAPVQIPATDWQAFKDGGDDAALDALKAQADDFMHRADHAPQGDN